MARKASDKPKYVKRTAMLREDQINRISIDGAMQGREFSAHLRQIIDNHFGPAPARKPNRGAGE